MTNNNRKWYQFHAGTQGDLNGVIKGHYNCLNFILKTQTISSFSSSIELQDENKLNGIWYKWKWTNQIQYRYRWYIRHYKHCAKRPITEYRFWQEISKIQEDGKLRNMWPVRPLQVNELFFLAFCQFYVSYDTTARPQLSASSATRRART